MTFRHELDHHGSGEPALITTRQLEALHAVVERGTVAGEPFISFGQPSATRVRIDAAFEAAGVERQLAIETHVSDTACGFVAEGAAGAFVGALRAALAEIVGGNAESDVQQHESGGEPWA